MSGAVKQSRWSQTGQKNEPEKPRKSLYPNVNVRCNDGRVSCYFEDACVVKYAHSAAAVLTRPKPSRWADCCAACARRRDTETREAMMSRSGCKESKVASGAFIIPSQHNYTPSGQRVYTQTERLSSQSIARVSWHRIYSGKLLTSSTRQRHAKQHGKILKHTTAAKGIITKQNEELNWHHISFFKLFHCLLLAVSKQTIKCTKLIQALFQWAVFFGFFADIDFPSDECGLLHLPHLILQQVLTKWVCWKMKDSFRGRRTPHDESIFLNHPHNVVVHLLQNTLVTVQGIVIPYLKSGVGPSQLPELYAI